MLLDKSNGMHSMKFEQPMCESYRIMDFETDFNFCNVLQRILGKQLEE